MNTGSKFSLYYLSLGSNMGDRAANIQKALEFLGSIGTIVKESSIYETQAVGMAPGSRDFLNMALGFESALSPDALLHEIKQFEKKMGRDIEHSHYLPRAIDIDILLAGSLVIDTENLVIPHPEMMNRDFVLIPLNEIAPDAFHPVLKKKIGDCVP